MTEQIRKSPLAGCTATGTLKLIAFLAMIIDHVGVVFFGAALEWRIIGRMAFPLFAWCLVVGAEYTRSWTRYAARLFLLLLISQPFYMTALHHAWYELNVFATLLTALFAIIGIRKRRFGSHIWAPILAVLTACLLKMDYGWKGVAFILLLYAVRGSRSGLIAVMIAFCLYWGQNTTVIHSVFGIPLDGLLTLTPYGSTLFQALLRVQTAALLALPLILSPIHKDIQMSKWISYSVYPAHLLILYLLQIICA